MKEEISHKHSWIISCTDCDAVLLPEENHIVSFTEDGWVIEHSLGCRIAGKMATCEYSKAILEVYEEYDPDNLGRWRITEIDSEGLPALERVE